MQCGHWKLFLYLLWISRFHHIESRELKTLLIILSPLSLTHIYNFNTTETIYYFTGFAGRLPSFHDPVSYLTTPTEPRYFNNTKPVYKLTHPLWWCPNREFQGPNGGSCYSKTENWSKLIIHHNYLTEIWSRVTIFVSVVKTHVIMSLTVSWHSDFLP